MRRFIRRCFGLGTQSRECVVLIGDDFQAFTQCFAVSLEHLDMPIYQLQTDSTIHAVQVSAHQSGVQKIRINLLDPFAVHAFVQQLNQAGYVVDLCVFQAACHVPDIKDESSIQQLQHYWQKYGLSTVSIAQVMIRQMLARSQGTLIFLGVEQVAQSDTDLLQQSVQASIRALAQSLAREFQPKGIHIVHCALTQWESTQSALMQVLSNTCYHLYQQPPSTWSQELRI